MHSRFTQCGRVFDGQRIRCILNITLLLCFPLLIIFPKTAGAIAGIMAIAGFIILIRYRDLKAVDWHFVAICLILPCSYVLNMILMGWNINYLDRPGHLLIGLMIFFLIRRYGIHSDVFFYSSCLAAAVAFGIAVFETMYLGNERVFGLNNRWNAVPFGNFSLLFGFFSICGVFLSSKRSIKNLTRNILGIFGFACGLGASVLSGTRGGWIAIPFLFLLIIKYNRRFSNKSRLISLGIVFFAVATIYAGSNRTRNRVNEATQHAYNYFSNPTALSAKSTSTGIRLSMWNWGIGKFLDHPVTGIGIANYKNEREAAVKSGEISLEFGRLANLHNELISTLALGGMIGVTGLIGFWILAWRYFLVKLKKFTYDTEFYYFSLCGMITVSGTALFSMTEGLLGTSVGTKALILTLAVPAGAISHLCMRQKSAAD